LRCNRDEAVQVFGAGQHFRLIQAADSQSASAVVSYQPGYVYQPTGVWRFKHMPDKRLNLDTDDIVQSYLLREREGFWPTGTGSTVP